MNFLIQNSLSFTASAILAALSINTACGQAAKVVGEKPKFEDILSPEFSGGKQKAFKPKDWLEIEAGLKVSLSPVPPSKVCEKLTVKWYVAVKNPEGTGMLLLTKDIDYINIPLDEEIFCSVYLSPGSVKLLTGSDRAGQNSVEAVGYEVLVNGVKVAEETSKFKVGWWAAASKSISRSDAVPLLKKTETPFTNMWWDRYAEVAVERR